jgi:hypothetical protein
MNSENIFIAIDFGTGEGCREGRGLHTRGLNLFDFPRKVEINSIIGCFVSNLNSSIFESKT